MSWPPTPLAADPHPVRRLEVLFDELAELTGQRNAIDARIVDIITEIDRDGLWGNTGCRSLRELIAWKTGCSPRNADTLTAITHRAQSATAPPTAAPYKGPTGERAQWWWYTPYEPNHPPTTSRSQPKSVRPQHRRGRCAARR